MSTNESSTDRGTNEKRQLTFESDVSTSDISPPISTLIIHLRILPWHHQSDCVVHCRIDVSTLSDQIRQETQKKMRDLCTDSRRRKLTLTSRKNSRDLRSRSERDPTPVPLFASQILQFDQSRKNQFECQRDPDVKVQLNISFISMRVSYRQNERSSWVPSRKLKVSVISFAVKNVDQQKITLRNQLSRTMIRQSHGADGPYWSTSYASTVNQNVSTRKFFRYDPLWLAWFASHCKFLET